jgi:hypothetical protein
MQCTNFSTTENIVLQICPQELAGETTVNGKKYKRTAAFIFLPDSNPGTTISCPLNYFQDSCSIPGKWIKNDSGQKLKLANIDKLRKVILTQKVDGVETEVSLSDNVSKRLFQYFSLDIENNLDKYHGFDCYALQSLLSDVKMYPPSPPFAYKATSPNVGDIVVLSEDKNIPNSIKHWALSLGKDMYLSKFGRSGEGADSQVTIMNLEGMMLLYDCKCCYVATPITEAEKWDA